MRAVILAGGFGTRISEESHLLPKPMIQIGGKPILWHIMKIYGYYGITDFVICLGYKGHIVKEYFANYLLYSSDITLDLASNKTIIHHRSAEPWSVTLIDTGANSLTGGRLARVREYVGDGDFCMTYGDGLADVNIKELIKFHEHAKTQGAYATVTAVQPPGRYGSLDLNGFRVNGFLEKPAGDGGWINGGFFVLSPAVFEYIKDDQTSWEQHSMSALAAHGRLSAYRHCNFWGAMDTLRDKQYLDTLWANGEAPWVVWE